MRRRRSTRHRRQSVRRPAQPRRPAQSRRQTRLVVGFSIVDDRDLAGLVMIISVLRDRRVDRRRFVVALVFGRLIGRSLIVGRRGRGRELFRLDNRGRLGLDGRHHLHRFDCFGADRDIVGKLDGFSDGGLVDPAALVAQDAATLELNNPAAHGIDDRVVVGRHDHGGSGAVDAVEDSHDADRRCRVEVSGRLVGKQDQRTVDERTRNRHPLLLTTGEPAWQPVGHLGKTNELEDLRNLAIDRRTGLPRHFHGECDVLVDGLVRQQLEVLEDRADRPAEVRDLPAGKDRRVLAGDPDVPVGRTFLAHHQTDERRLPGP